MGNHSEIASLIIKAIPINMIDLKPRRRLHNCILDSHLSLPFQRRYPHLPMNIISESR